MLSLPGLVVAQLTKGDFLVSRLLQETSTHCKSSCDLDIAGDRRLAVGQNHGSGHTLLPARRKSLYMSTIGSPAWPSAHPRITKTKGYRYSASWERSKPICSQVQKLAVLSCAGKDQTVGEMSCDADSHGLSMIQR